MTPLSTSGQRSTCTTNNVTPHSLRRTFGSHLINNGLRLEVVSKLLGHATTTITEHAYAQLLDDTTATRCELLHALQHHPTTNHHPWAPTSTAASAGSN